MTNYAAITIGPIINTLSIAASPGTLWCASSLFSWLSGNICERILCELPGAEIVVPAYEKGFVNKDGIGRFHDRIFFKCDIGRQALGEALRSLCDNAKGELAGHISDAIGELDAKKREQQQDYISRYVQLSWLISDEEQAKADEKNCILNLSQYLDCLELMAPIALEETDSPIFRLLSGTAESNNAYIYRKKNGKPIACWLIPKDAESGEFQLLKDDKARDISDIANPFVIRDKLKLRRYFAVVQSDGDEIGAFLKKCPSEHVWNFSKCCIKYAEEAAKRIGSYGGLTIYAGGDDILFLAPLIGRNGESLLDLCAYISGLFKKRFEDLAKDLNSAQIPTPSFGISINFEKSPLYEALEDARDMLFGHAKTGTKNQIALSIHKHSGQSMYLLLPNDNAQGAPLNKLIDLINTGGSLKKSPDEALHSVIYHLETFRSSFITSNSENMPIKNLFTNLFDAPAHDVGRPYIDKIEALYNAVSATSGACRADNGRDELTDKPVDVVTSMLRFVKLHSERGN